MTKPWKQYQEQSAEFFRSLGMTAQTDVQVQGARTTHDVDVLAKLPYAGLEIQWIVECKQWQTRVSKLHVFALREIVSEIGADRGILLAEAGFQSGAREAAFLTNIQLTSLAELRVSAESQVYAVRVTELYDRVQSCSERYWAIGKPDRIEYGLRPEFGSREYMGDIVIALADDLLKKAMRGVYPIESDYLYSKVVKTFPSSFGDVRELYNAVEQLVLELESKLTSTERALRK